MLAKKPKILLISLLGLILLSALTFGTIFGLRGFFNHKNAIPTANFSEVVDDNTDSDGDGLLDYEEVKLGTNIYSKDTDNDGFSDGEEVRLGYDPLKIQSGSNLDVDGDGLTGDDEKKYGTDPKLADTDFDGYKDGEEIASGNDPLKANLSDYIALKAVADAENVNNQADQEGSGETIVEVQPEDITQIGYLENALSSDNIYTLKDNLTNYIGFESEGGVETVDGEIILPEIADEAIKIGISDSGQAKTEYLNRLEEIFSQNISVFDNYSESSIAVTDNAGLGLMAEFTLFIQNLMEQIKATEVPNNTELINLHKNLVGALIQSAGLVDQINTNSLNSDEQSTIDVMNSFNQLTSILNDIVFDQILPQIESLTA